MKIVVLKENLITVKVTPKASKSEVIGWEGDIVLVRLKAQPFKGEANAELLSILSKTFNISKTALRLRKGHHSRIKIIEIEGVSIEQLKIKNQKNEHHN